MRYLFPFVSLLFLVSLLASCGGEPADTDTTGPAGSTETIRELIIVDSIGVELVDSNYVFGSIESSAHSINGNILILDRPACCTREYTHAGEFELIPSPCGRLFQQLNPSVLVGMVVIPQAECGEKLNETRV